MKRNLKKYFSFFSGYTELRSQTNRTNRIALLNGNLVGNEDSTVSGSSVRVNRNGYWGFAAGSGRGISINKLIQEAAYNAKFMASGEKKKRMNLHGGEGFSACDFSFKRKRLARKEIIEFVREIDGWVIKKYPKLKSRNIVLNTLDIEKEFLNSDRMEFFSFLPRTTLMINLSTETAKGSAEFFETWGGRGQFEELFSKPSDLYEKIEAQYAHLVDKAGGRYCDAGTKECILAPELAGVLAHEAIGHTTEADLVMGGSVAGRLLGKKVASSLITIGDFAHSFRGETCLTPVYVDDEGTKAEDVLMIDSGVLKSFLHNKESADHFNVRPTGNARAFTFADEPIIRMRNTAIVPGKSKLAEMISGVKDGYFMMRRGNGQADLTSEFMFSVTLGYEIRNGKLGKAIRDTTVSGVAYDVLKTVSMVSDDMYWRTFGYCGKTQPMLLSMGGPAIKCRINVGGR